MKTLLAALFALVLYGCGGCKAGDMKCDGSKVMMCDSNDQWKLYEDCAYSGIGTHCGSSPSVCSGYSDIACCY